MFRSTLSLLAIAILLTLNACWAHPWDIEDEESETGEADDDTTSDAEDDLPGGPSSDDDDSDLPDGPSDDDDATTPSGDDDSDLPDGPDDDDSSSDSDDDDDTTPSAPDTFEGDEAGECDDNVDNDGDGDEDCEDSTCAPALVCQPPVGDDDDSDQPPATDSDGDGWEDDLDCADFNASIHPGATEICDNGVDEDCNNSDLTCPPIPLPPESVCNDGADNDQDGLFDCADSNCATSAYCTDADSDGSPDALDCNDADDDIYPGAPDVLCDGTDSACNGIGNEADGDADSYMVCENDCDDADDEVNPGEVELCENGVDDDCSGTVDTNCPPDWCPTGSIVDLTMNTGFESAEPIEFFPTLDQRWGYGELLLSTPPARSCAGVAYNGACSLLVTGQQDSTEMGGAPWENQVRYLIDLEDEGVAVGDAIHVELALRGADPGLSVGVELLENWGYTPMTTIVGAISAQAPVGTWNPLTLDGDVTSVSGTLRLELQYGDLDAGEVVYVDDFLVQACIP